MDTFARCIRTPRAATPGGAISGRARETNAGWRIDYFIVSERLREKIGDALIYSDVYGSDHCPVGLVLDV